MLKKKLLSLLIATLALISIFNFLPAYADNGFTGRKDGECEPFLGMVPWDCGVEITNEDTLKAGIWTIAVNVAQDITIIASYLIIAYVIYGGYLYMFSGGEGSKVATGKKALTQGFIGLAIVISADLIMSTIRFVLMGGNGALSTNVKPNDLFMNAINWVITIAGIVSVIFLIYGGILYITSTGEPGKIKKAKDTIMYSLIGLAIVALAATITAIVSSAIRDANQANLVNQTLISKEVYEIKNN